MNKINIIPEKENNFAEYASIYDNKKVINSFDIFEQIYSNSFESTNVKFDNSFNGKLYLCYPLKVIAEVELNNIKDLKGFVKSIRDAYKEIYKYPEDYKIWGHWIGDLCIEGIEILENNLVRVYIGS